MTQRDNCVPFEDDLAAIYDETRPFPLPHEPIGVLDHFCRDLITAFSNEPTIRLLEVGSGTGRVTLGIARSFDRTLHKAGVESPKLEITVVERSEKMIEELRKKLSASISSVEILAEETNDIRDLKGEPHTFHAAAAHWVFHVIADWRVAVYTVDRLLRSDALVLTLQERSPLYEAIDGNIESLREEDDLAHEFWKTFHEMRASLLRSKATGKRVLSARSRLGSHVIDERVERMFSALGWDDTEDINEKTKWHSTFSLRQLIDKVVRPRAFTNMRLSEDAGQSSNDYAGLSRVLEKRFAGDLGKQEWKISTELSGRILRRSAEQRTALVNSDVLVHVARDTIGRRWKRKLDANYDRELLWQRLFSATWELLNSTETGAGPLSGCELEGRDSIRLFLAEAPFLEGKVLAAPPDFEVPSGNTEKLWHCLACGSETQEPFAILFGSPPGTPGGEAPTRMARAIDGLSARDIHPSLQILEVPSSTRDALQGLHHPGGDLYRRALAALQTASFREILEEATRLGIVSFGVDESEVHATEAHFLESLGALALLDGVSCIYIFPFDATPCGSTEHDAMGFVLLTSSPLPKGTVEFLWSLADVIFNEYLEDVLADAEVEDAQPEEPVKAAILADREPRVEPSDWPPEVLIVTATDTERKAIQELCGIGHEDLDARRHYFKKETFLDLGLDYIAAWSVETLMGSSGPGGSLATLQAVLTALEPKPLAVIMPGIAFGLQKHKQALGDILVCDHVGEYERIRQGETLRIERGSKPPASTVLVKAFKEHKRDWLPEETEDAPTVHLGLVLSGEKLVDDQKFVSHLTDRYPEALGGEMEATGLFVAALENGVDWILAKGICDWGYGKGSKAQAIAARNAVGLVLHILSKPRVRELLSGKESEEATRAGRLLQWIQRTFNDR